MELKDHINYWLKSSEHDLKVAETLYRNKKYDWCLFIGHLVLEKALKAVWVRDNNNKFPGKIHNLLKLAEETELQLNNKIKLSLLDINDFNIEMRYPDYKLKLYKRCNKKFTKKYFKIIKDIYKWLKKQISTV
ncbi:MAG: HEPN domain-containing protein [Candidatus Hydrogenedentota bacterium]